MSDDDNGVVVFGVYASGAGALWFAEDYRRWTQPNGAGELQSRFRAMDGSGRTCLHTRLPATWSLVDTSLVDGIAAIDEAACRMLARYLLQTRTSDDAEAVSVNNSLLMAAVSDLNARVSASVWIVEAMRWGRKNARVHIRMALGPEFPARKREGSNIIDIHIQPTIDNIDVMKELVHEQATDHQRPREGRD